MVIYNIMKKVLIIFFVLVGMEAKIFAFAAGMGFEDKCKNSELIIQCKVLDIISLSPGGLQLGKGNELKSNKNYAGPNSVALVHVQQIFKGNRKLLNTVIFIPCGYKFDESPCELSKSIKYVLFLEMMGRNFYHPLDPYCMHRISMDKVGLSGFDWEGDFDPKSKNGRNMPISEFIEKIARSSVSGKKK